MGNRNTIVKGLKLDDKLLTFSVTYVSCNIALHNVLSVT